MRPDMNNYNDAMYILDKLAASGSKCVIRYNIMDIRSDVIMDHLSPEDAKVTVDTIFNVAHTMGSHVYVSIELVDD